MKNIIIETSEKILSKVRLGLLYSALIIAVSSCRKDDMKPVSKLEDGLETIEFNATLPGLSNIIATYAITDIEENTVQSIEVLAFLVNNSGQNNESETFAFRSTAYGISTPDASNPSIKSFKIAVTKSFVKEYRFVVLVNVKNQLNAISLIVGESKNATLAKLIYDKTGNWNAVSTSKYNSFPMWGETEKVTISDYSWPVKVSLIRALARIDIKLSGAAMSDFVIGTIDLVNSPSSGLVAPSPGNYSASTKTVTKESIPSVPKYNNSIITYFVKSPGIALNQEIYVFESSKNSLQVNQTTATEVIIGGRYKGSSVVSYYRIALLDENGNSLPILRNFKYSLDITNVGGPGYPTREGALKNVPSNINVATRVWDDSDINIIANDGQYTLAISKDKLTLGGAANQSDTFLLYTDYPSGWWAQSQVDWLLVSYVKTGSICNVRIIAKSSNLNAATARTGTVLLTMGHAVHGRITKKITVTQRNTN